MVIASPEYFFVKCSKCKSRNVIDEPKSGLSFKEKLFALQSTYIRTCQDCGHSEEIKKVRTGIITH